MRYSDDFLDEIRARLPVSEVVRTRVPLKKNGREWRGLSPFNKEKTPSFFVNDQKGFYHDFSSGKSGDQFKFLMEIEGVSFPEAVERLAQMAGLPLPKLSREDEVADRKRQSLHEVMELASKFFENQFAGPSGKVARDYANKRGLNLETLREFRIGYASSNRFGLKEHLGRLGVSTEDMIATGLLIAGDDIPVPYDRFRDRLMIPIHDVRGRVVAFGGRALSSDTQAKYLNSPETTLFHKGSMVFNFHRARQPAHDDGAVVVVEGYMDAIAIYQAGIKSVVASMGTAFTEEQIATLWRLSDEPIVCFDADRAGIGAAHRAIDRILPALAVGRTFRFAIMQGEKDPDDLIREKGLDAFKGVLSGSLPLWDMLWNREVEFKEQQFNTPDSQAALEAKFRTIVHSIKDGTIRSAYLRRSRMQLANLFWDIEKSRRGVTFAGKGFVKSELRISQFGHRLGVQKIVLGMLVHYPEFLEEKLDLVERVQFEGNLEEFRCALYDLLIVHGDVSVHLIYSKLKPVFYEVLKEIHGEQDSGRPWGYRLFELFPFLKHDPPREFVSRCLDHFIKILQVENIADDIEALKMESMNPGASDDLGDQMIRLVREHQSAREEIHSEDMALAEIATEIRRVALGPEIYAPVAA
jgi:DNA primase